MTTFKLRRFALLAASTVFASLLMSAAHAQTAAYPDKPVRIIVPFTPGGASGIIGSKAAAKSAPDGYALLMVAIGHAVDPFMRNKLRALAITSAQRPSEPTTYSTVNLTAGARSPKSAT